MTVSIFTGDCRAASGRFQPGAHAYRSPKPHWEKAWLEREYVERRRSAADIARDIGCVESNVDYWLAKHQIPRRSVSEARAIKHWGVAGAANPMFGKVGPLNPRYVDGSSPERQRLYAQAEGKAFVRAVLARDRFQCVRCTARSTGPGTLHAHHIRPWAGNPALRFDLGNAVTLCRKCHLWVHSKKNTRGEYLA